MLNTSDSAPAAQPSALIPSSAQASDARSSKTRNSASDAGFEAVLHEVVMSAGGSSGAESSGGTADAATAESNMTREDSRAGERPQSKGACVDRDEHDAADKERVDAATNLLALLAMSLPPTLANVEKVSTVMPPTAKVSITQAGEKIDPGSTPAFLRKDFATDAQTDDSRDMQFVPALQRLQSGDLRILGNAVAAANDQPEPPSDDPRAEPVAKPVMAMVLGIDRAITGANSTDSHPNSASGGIGSDALSRADRDTRMPTMASANLASQPAREPPASTQLPPSRDNDASATSRSFENQLSGATEFVAAQSPGMLSQVSSSRLVPANDVLIAPAAVERDPVPMPVQPSLPAAVSAERVLLLSNSPGSPAWRTEFGEQVRILVGDRVQVAELHLRPADMGPVNIRITMTDQQASIVFIASHEDTRRSIEQALPQLRDMLTESGIRLDSASVGGQSMPNPQGTPQAWRTVHTTAQAALPQARVPRASSHLVDTYA